MHEIDWGQKLARFTEGNIKMKLQTLMDNAPSLAAACREVGVCTATMRQKLREEGVSYATRQAYLLANKRENFDRGTTKKCAQYLRENPHYKQDLYAPIEAAGGAATLWAEVLAKAAGDAGRGSKEAMDFLASDIAETVYGIYGLTKEAALEKLNGLRNKKVIGRHRRKVKSSLGGPADGETRQ